MKKTLSINSKTSSLRSKAKTTKKTSLSKSVGKKTISNTAKKSVANKSNSQSPSLANHVKSKVSSRTSKKAKSKASKTQQPPVKVSSPYRRSPTIMLEPIENRLISKPVAVHILAPIPKINQPSQDVFSKLKDKFVVDESGILVTTETWAIDHHPEPTITPTIKTRAKSRFPTSHPSKSSSHAQSKCPHCNILIKSEKLARHIRRIHPSVADKQEIQDTTKSPSANAPFIQRQVSTPSSRKMIKCGVCSSALREDRLQKHFSKMHPDLAPSSIDLVTDGRKRTFFKCSICSGQFNTEFKLVKHQLYAHPGIVIDHK